jgi:hypothetical protein
VGSCDSGYNCAYQATISWRNEVSPRPAEVDPRAVFERLFSDGMLSPKERQARKRADRSVLDFAKSDLSRLTRDVGAADQQKLDEYLTAVRSVESLIARSESFPLPKLPPGSRKPPNYPRNYEEHVGMMTELMRLAFLTDSTRVATFMLSREGVGEKFPDLGGNEIHHEISHHQNNPDKIAILKRIDLMHAQLIAKAFESFAQTKEGDKSLLDNTMMVFGSGLSDGNAHLHTNLPTLVAGRAGGKLVPQGFVKLSKPAPMCNLWLSLLNNMGVADPQFGDSQGVLPGFAV